MIQDKDKIEYLNEIEKEELRKFADNKTMKNAVKKIILKDLYDNGVLKAGVEHNPLTNSTLALAMAGKEFTNDQIGEVLRAQAEGIRTIQIAYDQIDAFRTVEKPKEQKKNDAR